MPDFEFAPPGNWTLSPRDLQTANEEAAHATVAALLGLEIVEARMDRPDVGVAGHVTIAPLGRELVDCDEDIERAAYRRLLATLAGPVLVRTWPTGTWPLDERDPGDVGFAARMCRWLKFDAVELFVAEPRTKRLLEDRAVRRALTNVSRELVEQRRFEVPGCMSLSPKPTSTPRL